MKKMFSKIEKVMRLVKKAVYFAWHRHHFLIPPSAMKKYIKSFFVVLKRSGSTANLVANQKAYIKWLKENEVEPIYKKFKYNPKISVIIPVYNVSRKLLSECLDSILNQTYENFEICLADDHSSNEETINTLKEYEQKDERIKVVYRKENGMISAASNSALEQATGEFIMLVDNDDTISKDAMYYMVETLNNDKNLDFIYSDEDKLDYNGNRCEPHFKPDYSPDTLMSINYICHLSMIRKSIVDELGGFRSEYDGSQDYDLFLRVIEVTNNIHHIDKILYHWRQTPTSTAGSIDNKNYTIDTSIKALNEALKRRNIKGNAYKHPNLNAFLINYEHDNPLVSIIIPTRDKVNLLKNCVDSIIEKCTYKNYEIVVADNDSVQEETLEFFKEYKKKYKNFLVEKVSGEFNYSKINNEAIKKCNGEYVLLLNNDTKVIESDFLDKMVGYAIQKHVGAVGIKLLYADKKVQHAGVVLGYGGVAGHIYVTSSMYDNGVYGRLSLPYNYTAVTAACLLVSKKKYLEVNGLDENLKVALNDVDFNLKLLKNGYYNVLLPHVTMYHLESKSRGYEVTKERQERLKKEEKYMIEKWEDYLEKDRYFSKYYI